MSLWRFGDFEEEVDFTDADLLDRLDEAEIELEHNLAKVPKVGKMGDIARAQCNCFRAFFDTLFGGGAGEMISQRRNSMAVYIKAVESLAKFREEQYGEYEEANKKYQVQQHGNRQQRRNYEKNKKKNYHSKRYK